MYSWVDLEASRWHWTRDPGFEIQRPNHSTITCWICLLFSLLYLLNYFIPFFLFFSKYFTLDCSFSADVLPQNGIPYYKSIFSRTAITQPSCQQSQPKSTMKTPKQCGILFTKMYRHQTDAKDIVLLLLLTTFHRLRRMFWCFHCWFLMSKCKLGSNYFPDLTSKYEIHDHFQNQTECNSF